MASYTRLSPSAQQLLADLSVCVGGFFLDAAKAIGDAETIEGVRELVEASWLHKGEMDGRARYEMLEVVRAFAAEERASLSSDAPRRHVEHFLHVAQTFAVQWDTPQQVEAISTFACEWHNIERGFLWACEHGPDEWVCAYACSVFPFLTLRGRWSVRLAWAQAWLKAAESVGDARERCRALVACGEALRTVEAVERSKTLLQDGLRLAREMGDAKSAGEALLSLFHHAKRESSEEHLAQACDQLRASLEQFRRANDLAGQARTLWELSHVLAEEADRAAAAAEMLQLSRALGSLEGQVSVLNWMGGNCVQRGSLAEGRQLWEEALKLAETAGMGAMRIAVLAPLGDVCQRMGNLNDAERYFTPCLQRAQQMGDLYCAARAQDALANLRLLRGEPERAHPLIEASYQTFLRLNASHGLGDVLICMGQWAQQMGNVAEAERLLRQSVAVHRARGSAKSVSFSLWRLGQLYRDARRYDETRQVLEESLRHHRCPEVLLELGGAAAEQGDAETARRRWMEGFTPMNCPSYRLDFARALKDVGRLAVKGGEEEFGALLLGVAARELQAMGVKAKEEVSREADAALHRLGSHARAVRRQIARTPFDEAVGHARTFCETASSLDSHAPPPAHHLRIYLLGRFEVWRHEEPLPVSAFGRPKVAALLKWLCLQGGRRVSREAAMEALWGNLPPHNARRNLAVTLSMLRRTLGALATVCLHSDAETLQLTIGGAVWVDAFELARCVSAAKRCQRDGDLTGMAQHCRAALALYSGELLPDEPLTEWALPERKRLAQMLLTAMVPLAEYALAQGDPVEANALAGRAMQQDPWEESAMRVQMKALARQGRRTEALRCFQQFREALRRDLDAEPEAETMRLYHRLRTASSHPSGSKKN